MGSQVACLKTKHSATQIHKSDDNRKSQEISFQPNSSDKIRAFSVQACITKLPHQNPFIHSKKDREQTFHSNDTVDKAPLVHVLNIKKRFSTKQKNDKNTNINISQTDLEADDILQEEQKNIDLVNREAEKTELNKFIDKQDHDNNIEEYNKSNQNNKVVHDNNALNQVVANENTNLDDNDEDQNRDNEVDESNLVNEDEGKIENEHQNQTEIRYYQDEKQVNTDSKLEVNNNFQDDDQNDDDQNDDDQNDDDQNDDDQNDDDQNDDENEDEDEDEEDEDENDEQNQDENDEDEDEGDSDSVNQSQIENQKLKINKPKHFTINMDQYENEFEGESDNDENNLEDNKNLKLNQKEEQESSNYQSQENVNGDQEIDYIQGDLIQEGARVYSALNILNGRLLAIKIYELQQDDLELACDVLDRISNLEHDNIHNVITYDLSKGPQLFTVIMPFESGGSIKWLLQKFSKFQINLAVMFMKQILEGLNYIHQQGLNHQNLKTSNILVDSNASAKLNDVNILSKYQLSMYSAPECFEGGEYTSYADVWSAGCIFIEMLTQFNPWQQQYGQDVTLEDIKSHLQNGRLFSLQSVDSPEILQVLKMIFKKNPQERLSAEQLLDMEFLKLQNYDDFKQSVVSQGQLGNVFNLNNQDLINSQAILIQSRNLQTTDKKNNKKTEIKLTQSINKLQNFGQTQKDLMNPTSTILQRSTSQQPKVVKTNEDIKNKALIQQSNKLKHLMSQIYTVDNDLISSLKIDEGANHSLSYNDLRMVITKKTHNPISGINDIIEEEDQNDRSPHQDRQTTNQYFPNNDEKMIHLLLGDKQDEIIQKSLTKEHKKSELQVFGISKQLEGSSVDIDEQHQNNSDQQIKKDNSKNSQNKIKIKKQPTDNLLPPQSDNKALKDQNLVLQLIGPENYLKHQQQLDAEKLNDMINQQFYGGEDTIKHDKNDDERNQQFTNPFDAYINQQFYDSYTQNNFESQIEKQFYQDESKENDQEFSQKKLNFDNLELLMGQQFYDSLIVTKNPLLLRVDDEILPKEVQIQDKLPQKILTNDRAAHFEAMIGNQFYSDNEISSSEVNFNDFDSPDNRKIIGQIIDNDKNNYLEDGLVDFLKNQQNGEQELNSGIGIPKVNSDTQFSDYSPTSIIKQQIKVQTAKIRVVKKRHFQFKEGGLPSIVQLPEANQEISKIEESPLKLIDLTNQFKGVQYDEDDLTPQNCSFR